MLLCGVTFISFFYSLHCPLSGPDLTYISLLIIPCIIYYVTNKETLNLEECIVCSVFFFLFFFLSVLHSFYFMAINITCHK